MVHIKTPTPTTKDGSVDIDTWILNHPIPEQSRPLIKSACELARLTGEDHPTRFGSNCFLQGLELAEILSELSLDAESLAAAIVYSAAKNANLPIEDIAAELNKNVAKLTEGVLQLGMINLSRQKPQKQSTQQIDNVRKMILAMVQDVRVVVIKLAERLSMMRTLKNFSKEFRQHIAEETMEIFAPLANRLGLHQIKWELEDLAFLNLEPDTYKNIAKHLDEKRSDRDRRVEHIVNTLNKNLKEHQIKATVYGRAKHIYSIQKKMLRKNVDFKKIYDAIAVRILVNSKEECYAALSIAHELWEPIPAEFDDYISQPKSNGYQSIHTAVIDKDGKYFEIQIRTQTMHETSELGVAAHWVYKEDSRKKQSAYEEKIAWLRTLLEWQKELTNDQETPEYLEQNSIEDRVYVFTPNNDVIDLTAGSTPLDFAYFIHTQIGHHCRGAKVGGKIVPLTYQLQMGDKVEILTNNNGEPSRDWMSPKLGFLKTAAARAKVAQFFKKKDFDAHVDEGREILEKELQKQHLRDINLTQIASALNIKSAELMFAALASGNMKLAHIINTIKTLNDETETQSKEEETTLVSAPTKTTKKDDVSIHGMENLLTKIAKCCKPIPGDPIIGYITQEHGITIHHQNCNNIHYAKDHQARRLIEVNWNQMSQKFYPVDIEIIAHDRSELIKDISATLANEKIKMTAIAANASSKQPSVKISATIEIHDIAMLTHLIDRLQQIPNILSVKRPLQKKQ